MASIDPAVGDGSQLTVVALSAVLLGFSAATQDIVIDAYRIETASVKFQPMMASIYMGGYRVGMIVAGAGALYLASYFGSSMENYSYQAWSKTYYFMACFALVGIVTTLVIREPKLDRVDDGYSSNDYIRFFGVVCLCCSRSRMGFQ